jgi:hypothetical protein
MSELRKVIAQAIGYTIGAAILGCIAGAFVLSYKFVSGLIP